MRRLGSAQGAGVRPSFTETTVAGLGTPRSSSVKISAGSLKIRQSRSGPGESTRPRAAQSEKMRRSWSRARMACPRARAALPVCSAAHPDRRNGCPFRPGRGPGSCMGQGRRSVACARDRRDFFIMKAEVGADQKRPMARSQSRYASNVTGQISRFDRLLRRSSRTSRGALR